MFRIDPFFLSDEIILLYKFFGGGGTVEFEVFYQWLVKNHIRISDEVIEDLPQLNLQKK